MNKILISLIAIYIILFISFYPSYFTSLDENNFIRFSYMLTEGRLYETDPARQIGLGRMDNRFYPYFIGQSILLLPFTPFGWESMFLLGMILHIIGAVVFYKIIVERQGKSIWYVAFFLFYPYLLFHSATLYSDFSSAIFILLAFFFYLKDDNRNHYASGAMFGIAFMLRYTNAIAVIPFFIYCMVKDRQKLARLSAGMIPFILVVFSYNFAMFGSPFRTPYDYAGSWNDEIASSTAFSMGHITEYFPYLAFRLILVYPLMLIAPFLYKRKGRWEIMGCLILFLIIFSMRFQSGTGFGLGPSTLTRYMLPIMPLMLITYTDMIERLLKAIKLPEKPVLLAIFAILIILSAATLYGFSNYLNQQRICHEFIYETTEPGSLIIGKLDYARYILEGRRFLDIERANITEYDYLITKNASQICNLKDND